MYDEIIQLVSEGKYETIPGQGRKKIRTKRTVFAEIKSISQTEFYQAQAAKLKPELKFEIADYYDYQGEKELLHEGVIYKILKTYRKGRQLEITVYGGVRDATT